ncbi:MAG: adenosine monophosphate-protein transferase [Phycisphaerae bacterium]|nr:MAG: adenosine monophosphate-protein transferase [Phycisphaerae bacterium]
MPRTTGTYRLTRVGNEEVRAFVSEPLPPKNPPLVLDEAMAALHAEAVAAVGQLGVAGAMVPSAEWFLYGFVRKEALVSSEIEGTQATLQDVVTYEATKQAERPDDVREVCNYVDALTFAREQIAKPKGLPLSTRLLCEAHKRLMRGVRGADKRPGEIRRSQNWIGGTRPGNARFVPPPPEDVPALMAQLDKWLYSDDALPPLVKAGLAHVQFETIHPFLDGNGRIGRLLITLLLEHWGLLKSPMLYLSLAFKRRQQEYYARLGGVRTEGEWEAWTRFYLECVREAADDGVRAAQAIFAIIGKDRARLIKHAAVTVPAVRLLDLLPSRPVVTLPLAVDLLGVSKPTAIKAIEALESVGVLKETSGKRRDRVYAYQKYLDTLTGE